MSDSEDHVGAGTGNVSDHAPVVQHRRGAGYYYGQMPYYGGHPPVPYGGYGSYYGEYGQAITDAEDSLVGNITIGRILRVCQQRWITILVFCILGAAASLAVYKIMPTMYQAVSLFEMSVRPGRITKMSPAVIAGSGQEPVGSIDEIFNTRLVRLRSRAMIELVLSRYRIENPNPKENFTDSEIFEALVGGTEMTLQRRSRIVRIAVRSQNPQLAADLANAYASAAEIFAQEENKTESDTAVEWLKTTVDAQRRVVERTDLAILDFRVANQIDTMENEKYAIGKSFERVNADLVAMELEILRANELLNALEAVRNDLDQFGAFPESMPRMAEMSAAYQKLQEAIAERNAMLAKYTAKHPDVQVQEKVVEVYRKQFTDVVWRARETVTANLGLLKRQFEPIKARSDELEKSYAALQIKIDSANARLEQLKREQEINDITYKSLLNRMEEARIASDENTATIKLIEKTQEPKVPVSPNPFIIFPAGPILGLMLGVFFVLIIDHLEDKLTSITDVELRLRTKVLCVLPHVRRVKRAELALIVAEDKFTQFAESLAGLRNLLDSPRYRDTAKVLLIMSTQPGEGKTITSSNLALSYAASGQKTLLIDFDMRRPRIAGVYKKSSKEYESLPHMLSKNDTSVFGKLPVTSGFANLDLVLSRASSEISPAHLMGTGAINAFFNWARENYDRIIIDSPPFGVVGDTVALSSLCDSVMLMCCPGRSRFRPMLHAIRHLSSAGANVIGVLVNDVDFGRRSMFSGYDYHYRYAYRYASKYGTEYSTRRPVGSAPKNEEAIEPVTQMDESKPAISQQVTVTIDEDDE